MLLKSFLTSATAFNLINDIDIAATEARIAEHRAANAALIELNEQREAKDAANLRDIEERERLDRQQRAEEARRAEEEEERERERNKLELINQLVRFLPSAERFSLYARHAGIEQRTCGTGPGQGQGSTASP